MVSPPKAPNPVQKRLNQAVERAGISQKNLGIQCGLDPSVASSRVNHYCTGRHTPNFNLLEKMATVLKVPVAFFYTADDEMARLLANFNSLPAKARKEIVRLSDRLLGSAGD